MTDNTSPDQTTEPTPPADQPEETALAEVQAALRKLDEVWNEPGQHVDYHEYQMDRLKQRWRTLYDTVLTLTNIANPDGRYRRGTRPRTRGGVSAAIHPPTQVFNINSEPGNDPAQAAASLIHRAAQRQGLQ